MPHFHGNVSGHVHGDGSWSTTPTIGTITPTADGCVFTHSGGGTHYRVFLLAGAPGSWVSLGSSPVTLTGLTVNTEYTLQLSGDGSTVADAENWGTLNPGTGSGEPEIPPPPVPVSSSAVIYLPVRMVSGLWATAGVDPSLQPGNESWLPAARQSIGYVYVGGQRLPVEVDSIWYRAMQYLFETRLGGRNAPSVPDVVTAVTQTQATAAAATATINEVAQQTQANAEALFVVREVVQGGALDGAEQIPGVDLR